MRYIAVSHELRHHRILGRDELDDNVGLEAREPGDQLRERYVPSDRQMVNERKRQDQIRTRTRLKCLTLLVAPTQTPGRVGEVADQRKDRRVLFNLQRTIQAFDGQMVGIDGDDVIGARTNGARVITRVTHEVPHERWTPKPGQRLK